MFLCYCSVLCLLCLCARLFICAHIYDFIQSNFLLYILTLLKHIDTIASKRASKKRNFNGICIYNDISNILTYKCDSSNGQSIFSN